MDWAEKYRPAHLDEVVGNSTALRQMLDWARNWSRDKKPLILYGKPGTGKTSSAHALGNDMHWEVIELNASDQRTRAVIERVAGSGSTTRSLFSASRKLIIIDEADNLHGTADRGGARAIVELLKGSCQPIILIANDLYAIPGEIRSRCDGVQFKALQARSIAPRLRYICAAEKITCNEDALHHIAETARGDMRAAVNMLYASAAGRDRLEGEILPSRKDERSSIFDLIIALYGKMPSESLLKLAYDVDETPDTLIQWIEANLAGIEEIDAIDGAYTSLSRADEYLGYTYRQQYYTLWRYATALMVLGVGRVTGGKGLHARISAPERWRRMSSYQKQKAVRSSMLRKVSSSLHMPQRTFLETYMSPLSTIIDRDPLTYAREFSLDTEELDLFIHDRRRAASVTRILASEEKERDTKKEKETGTRKRRDTGNTWEKKEIPPPQKEAPHPEPSLEKPSQRNQKTLFEGF
ncbi:MAG: replication factor C large subunit [Methanolinea sp.]|jgi:replication factor C large subunit|nr:replication factor C large subunit [Methanolinea sp.]